MWVELILYFQIGLIIGSTDYREIGKVEFVKDAVVLRR